MDRRTFSVLLVPLIEEDAQRFVAGHRVGAQEPAAMLGAVSRVLRQLDRFIETEPELANRFVKVQETAEFEEFLQEIRARLGRPLAKEPPMDDTRQDAIGASRAMRFANSLGDAQCWELMFGEIRSHRQLEELVQTHKLMINKAAALFNAGWPQRPAPPGFSTEDETTAGALDFFLDRFTSCLFDIIEVRREGDWVVEFNESVTQLVCMVERVRALAPSSEVRS